MNVKGLKFRQNLAHAAAQGRDASLLVLHGFEQPFRLLGQKKLLLVLLEKTHETALLQGLQRVVGAAAIQIRFLGQLPDRRRPAGQKMQIDANLLFRKSQLLEQGRDFHSAEGVRGNKSQA